MKPKGPLFFGSVEPFIKGYGSSSKHKMLIIDINNITMIDLSGAYALEDLINNLKVKKVRVVLFNTNVHIEKVLEN